MNNLGQHPDYLTLLDDDNEFGQDIEFATEEAPRHSLPFDLLEQQELGGMRQLIHASYRQEAALARDVAYLGSIDVDFVTSNHNITREELVEKLKQPAFAKLVEKFQNEIGEDSGGMLRVRSHAYLDSSIGRLHEIIMSRETKDENVIKAMTLLSQLGGAMPKASGVEGAGTHITFNFGSDNPMMQARQIIEGETT